MAYEQQPNDHEQEYIICSQREQEQGGYHGDDWEDNQSSFRLHNNILSLFIAC